MTTTTTLPAPAAALTALTADIPTRTADDRDRLRHYATLWLENRSDSTAAHHAYRALLTLLGCTEPGAAAVHWQTLADASRHISGGRTNLAMTALAAAVIDQIDAPVRGLLDAAYATGHPDLVAALYVAGALALTSGPPTCCGRPMDRDGEQYVCRQCGAWVQMHLVSAVAVLLGLDEEIRRAEDEDDARGPADDDALSRLAGVTA